MYEKTPYTLADYAFKNKELDKFFQGQPPYDYVAKFSSAPGNADLSDLIYQGLLPYLHDHPNIENIKYTKQTLENLCESHKGLYSVASFILQASIYGNNNDGIHGINLNDIAEHLTKAVIDHKDILLKYYSSLDSRCNLYDTIKILSKNTSSVGGPSFFSEEHNHGIKM